MFEWDRNNLRKIRGHRVSREEAQEALLNEPIPIYEQDVGGESRVVYYGETISGRLLGLVVTERGDSLRVVTAYNLIMPARSVTIFRSERTENREMKSKKTEMPTFKSESEEADWWASPAGRAFVKEKSTEIQSSGMKIQGSALVGKLNKTRSTQIALRLPETDLARARKLASRKGIGYQTLLKMLVHEGLSREARRSIS